MGYKNKGLRVGIGGRGKKGPIAPGLLFNNVMGQRFGDLRAVKYEGHSRWLCQCECGGTKIARATDLVRGRYRSCGCYRQKIRAAAQDRERERLERNPSRKRGRPYGWGSTLAGIIANR